MERYVVEFKALKTGEWYTKTKTDSYASACSVAICNNYGRAYRIIDTLDNRIIIIKLTLKSNSFPFKLGNTFYVIYLNTLL